MNPLQSSVLPPASTLEGRLRVATYNIHKGVRGVGPAKRLEIHNLGLAVEALDADVVCLQEVRLFHTPATISIASGGTLASTNSASRATCRTRLEWMSPKCATTTWMVVPCHCTGACSRPRCSKRWSLTSWCPMSPIGQRDTCFT